MKVGVLRIHDVTACTLLKVRLKASRKREVLRETSRKRYERAARCCSRLCFASCAGNRTVLCCCLMTSFRGTRKLSRLPRQMSCIKFCADIVSLQKLEACKAVTSKLRLSVLLVCIPKRPVVCLFEVFPKAQAVRFKKVFGKPQLHALK